MGLSRILDRTIELVGRVLEGPGGSQRVWKVFGRVLGGSLEGPRIQASLEKVGHPGTRWVPVLRV